MSDGVRQHGVGEPDDLDRLWTPHRMAYIRGENKPVDESAGECPFCQVPKMDDDYGLVVHRGELAYAVLNLYPYSPGHLMVCPYRHVADYTDATQAEVARHRRPDPDRDAGDPGGVGGRRASTSG